MSDELYPAGNALRWRSDPTDGSTLCSVSFAPLQYNPLAMQLLGSTGMTVHLSLRESKADVTPLIGKLNSPPSPLDPEERCDYLIISTSNLIARSEPPFDFNALLAARRRSGYNCRLLPVELIYANYAGADPPAKIRDFLQDAHALWGLKYLLIAGTHQMIPSRKLYISVPSFAITSSDHIYYGCMDGSYDGNGNGRYGEYNDGDGGGDVDLTAEILTGRFPVANEVELAHMVRKTLRHQEASREEFFNNGFISEKVDFGTIVYAEPFMEEIRNGSSTYNKINLGYTNSPYESDFITTNNLHDRDGYLFSRTECLNYLTNRLYSINHLGHGARYQCMKLNVLNANDYSSLQALQNPFPYFIYSQACESGAFDTPDCFAEQLVTVSNAAAAVVMNSRNGWASSSSVSGYSQYFHHYFWDGAFRGSATTYGEMNEYARRKNLSSIPKYNGSFWRWVYYELNLLGDPAMPVLPALLNVPPQFTHTPLPNTFDTCTNVTAALISMTNRLEQYSTVTVTPSDPMGNSGEPLELTALILNPLSDYDQDGSITAHEELAGTDAKNPQSVFIIRGLAAEGDAGFRLSWTTVSGRSYSVESTPQLSGGAWTPVDGFTGLPGTGSEISVVLPPGTGAKFFRVRVE